MSQGPDKTQMMHQWSIIVIPIGDKDNIYPLLVAHCKNCNNYLTKRLAHSAHPDESGEFTLRMGDSGLPKWGCSTPEGIM